MRKLYVIDTCALISFFYHVFVFAQGYEGSPQLSKRTNNLIAEAIYSEWTQVRLSIPTVVFVEIFEKWFHSEEFCRLFFYEIFSLLKRSENIEICPIDREVLENVIQIGGPLKRRDLHDRLILASAIALSVPLITTDEEITNYVNVTQVIPHILN